MKRPLFILTTLAIISLSRLVNAQASDWLWAQTAVGDSPDIATSTATDASGNVIVAGYFISPLISFGPNIFTNVSSGNSDMFLVKYDPAGNVLWAKSAGGNLSDAARSVAVDNLGNILVAGVYGATITFDTITLTATGGHDMFIVKYNSAGDVLWAKSGSGSDADNALTVIADALGNLIVAGTFQSTTITFDSITCTNAGFVDMFIAKYDQQGNVLWAKSAGGSDYDCASSVAVDVAGNIILAGGFTSSAITFDTTTLVNTYPTWEDIFIVKYDPAGNLLSARSESGGANEHATSIVIDDSGNLIMAGNFDGQTITFGNITLTKVDLIDMFIVKYDATGTVLWAKSAGGSYYDHSTSVTSDASGNLVLTGYFDSPVINFGNIALANVTGGVGGATDMFIVKYDPGGNLLWAKSIGGNYSDEAYSITTDFSGDFLIAGLFGSSTISFGTTTLTNSSILIGKADMFIAKLSSTTGIEEIQNQSAFSIAPNPFASQTTISFRKEQINTIIKIMDVLGKEINQLNFTGKQLILEKGELQAGIYFIQSIDINKNVLNQKIIVE